MESVISSDGVAIAYERRGAGPRMYVCHGGPANDHRYIADDLDALTERFEFVFCDYRGSDVSDNADSLSYTLDRFRTRPGRTSPAPRDDSITVLGHSMGGFVALAFAVGFAEHCERLILTGTWPTNAPRHMLPSTLRALGGARFAKMIGRGCAWVVMYS
jgi:pimeloyl-ACP methyl ester carboxylesterase